MVIARTKIEMYKPSDAKYRHFKRLPLSLHVPLLSQFRNISHFPVKYLCVQRESNRRTTPFVTRNSDFPYMEDFLRHTPFTSPFWPNSVCRAEQAFAKTPKFSACLATTAPLLSPRALDQIATEYGPAVSSSQPLPNSSPGSFADRTKKAERLQSCHLGTGLSRSREATGRVGMSWHLRSCKMICNKTGD